ncbi:MAG: hypothetical protein EHM21_10495, partial [Chloroflexi bacterium]
MSQLRTDKSGSLSDEGIGENPAGSAESDVPDWLSRIRDRAKTETGGQEQEPDWMSGLQGEAPGDQGLDDWLSRIPGGQEAGPEEQKPPSPGEPEMGGPGAGPADWLRGFTEDTLSGSKGGETPAFESGSSETGEDDWMGKLSAWQADLAGQEGQSPQENTPAFRAQDELNRLGGEDETSSGQSEQPFTSGTGLTGFLESLNQPGAQEDQAGEMNEDSFPGGEQASAAAPVEGMPDWFSSAPPSQEAGQPEFTTPDASEGESGLAGWLQGLEDETPEQPPAGAAAHAIEEMGLPDWLEAPVDEPPPTTTTMSPFTQSPAEGEAGKADLPDWLSSDFEPAEESASQAGEAEASGADAGSLPDWFSSFEQEDIEKTQPSRTGQLTPVEDQGGEQEPTKPVESSGVAGSSAELLENVPDWLHEFQSNQLHEAGETAAPLVDGEKTDAEKVLDIAVGAAMASAFTDSAVSPEAESGDQPFTVDLPEWLGEDAAMRPVVSTEQPADVDDEQLAQAELPEWVKEMRPLESILPGDVGQAEVDQRVENSGPLAGMRGVLPVDDAATHYRKPPVYSIKLRVTEKQRTQATLLESILAQESQPLLIPPERSRATDLVGRVLVAVIL